MPDERYSSSEGRILEKGACQKNGISKRAILNSKTETLGSAMGRKVVIEKD